MNLADGMIGKVGNLCQQLAIFNCAITMREVAPETRTPIGVRAPFAPQFTPSQIHAKPDSRQASKDAHARK